MTAISGTSGMGGMGGMGGMTTAADEAFRRWADRVAAPRPAGLGRVPRSAAGPVSGSGPAAPSVLRDDPPPPAPSADVLRLLVQDAAGRARALLDGDGADPADPADPASGAPHDAARLLGDPVHRGRLEHAAAHLGLTTVELRHLVLAYEFGGSAGVDVIVCPRPADPGDMAAAHHAIQPLRPAPTATLVTEGDRLTDTAARVQLRLGADRWYPFIDWHGTWRPVPGHSPDPAAAYTAARQALRGV